VELHFIVMHSECAFTLDMQKLENLHE
jgi:hypothetical protein